MREYLPSLIPRKKWDESGEQLKINDIVLILDENTERNKWKRGVFTRLFPGKDKEIRVAQVRTMNGLILRPARKLTKFAE